MCDITCVDTGITIVENILNSILDAIAIIDPTLIIYHKWLLNGYHKFKDQLPPNILSEIELQLHIFTTQSVNTIADVTLATNVTPYITIFLVVLFIYFSIIWPDYVYLFMLLSFIIIIAAVVFVALYAKNGYNKVYNSLIILTTDINTIISAFKSGLCCIAATNCGSDCDGKCLCQNVPTVTFTSSPISGKAPLFVTFTPDTSTYVIPPKMWFWQFGDGNINNTQSSSAVNNTYINSGIYQVILSVDIQITGVDVGTFTSEPTTITVTV